MKIKNVRQIIIGDNGRDKLAKILTRDPFQNEKIMNKLILEVEKLCLVFYKEGYKDSLKENK